MVKRVSIIIFILALSFLIVGCRGLSSDSAMHIQPAALSEEESQIMQLVKPSASSSEIYDYTVNNEVKSVSVTCYKLDENGKWIVNDGPSSFPLTNSTGRVAISFGNLGEGMRVAVQDGDSINAGETNSGPKEATAGMGCATSYASNRESIECEKEIPLAMQVFTSKDEINSCGVEFFDKPEEIQKSGYEEVYGVTIKFSNYELI